MSDALEREEELAGGGLVFSDSDENEHLPPVELKLNLKDVTPYYLEGGKLCPYDIIAYIRSIYPNPWQKVIVDTTDSLFVEDFEKVLIYFKGVNDQNVDSLTGIIDSAYIPIKIDTDSAKSEDYGLAEKVIEFETTYNLHSFDILVYGEDEKLMADAWAFFMDSTNTRYRVHFPAKVAKKIRVFSDGLDIAPYAKQINSLKAKNMLTPTRLREIMNEVREQVKAGKTQLQNTEDVMSTYAEWIILCATQELNLVPVYLRSYIGQYVYHNIGHTLPKLSMFERIAFLRNLPKDVGYIGKVQEFRCRFEIVKKIYPTPALVFHPKSGQVITDHLERFTLDKVELIDWRTMFKQSKAYFVSDSALTKGNEDYESDMRISDIFLKMSEAAHRDGLILTVRNCVMAITGDKNSYVLYYDEPLGATGVLYSKYFGKHVFTLREEDFKNLIDVKIVLAMDEEEKRANEGGKVFNAIMTKVATTFKPSIPTFVLMCSELCDRVGDTMSYYDRSLRCDFNIAPIVTHIDSELSKTPTVFDYIDYNKVKHDSVASNYISAFGTLNSFGGEIHKLRVSIDTFKGESLL